MITSLILDLDDTIFPTRSIGREYLEPLFRKIPFPEYGYTEKDIEDIFDALWEHPMADVAASYNFPEKLIREYHHFASVQPFEFNIRPYQDYDFLTSLPQTMHLVTTGTTPVQQKKIDALGIRADFKHILVNDPFIFEGGKKACFEKILEIESLQPDEVLVIGDNKDSEIAAAKKLAIPWVLIDRKLGEHDPARNSIADFHGLISILGIDPRG